ncbi:hypothetical protein [Jiulongibacter sp. NS-SX5]
MKKTIRNEITPIVLINNHGIVAGNDDKKAKGTITGYKSPIFCLSPNL